MKQIKYYFILSSIQFLVEEEPLEEVLRERAQYYCRTGKNIDFWLLPKPAFLQSQEFEFLQKKVSNRCLAIISTNKIFITWLKLRLNNVFTGEFVGPNENIPNPLDFFEIPSS